MSIFEDAYDVADDAVSTVVDTAGDAVRAVPGGAELLRAAGHFANTGVGLAVLRAMSTMFYASVAWPLGPQLASVMFAVPGLARGDDFTHAWLTEVKWRAEETAKVLGPGIVDAFGKQLTDALRKLAEEYGGEDLLELGVSELAARFHIREDVAAFALAIWNHVKLPSRDEFDPATGRQLGVWSSSSTPASPCALLAERRRRFGVHDPRPDLVTKLVAACSASPDQIALAQSEYRALYGAREWEALGLGDRERAALTRATAPASSSSSGAVGTVALVVALGVAVVAWRRGLV